MITDRRLPPQAIDAEMSVLGSVFVDNDCIDTIHSLMVVDDFYRESHRLIFRAMAGLADRNEPIDLITMTSALKTSRQLEQVGGGAYLATLVDFVPMAANVAHYCKIVKGKADARRLIVHAQDALEIVYSDGDIAQAIEKLENAVQPNLDASNNHPVIMAQSLKEAIKRIEIRYENKGEIQGLPYGINDLDKATSGMHPGELIIIAGRPSMGKSALAGNIISNVCAEGKAGILFTLEMSRADIVDRLTAAHRVKYQNIRSGKLEENDWPKLTKAAGKMNDWKLYIDDTPAISLREVRAKARRQKREGLELIVIDYLQLMSVADPRVNRVQGIGEISRGLKQLARELDLPIILLSQLNRSVDGRPDKRPMMSDLRDSGEIEQDADVIIFPYRPAAYCQQCRDKVDDGSHSLKEHQAKAEIIIEKQRAGERNLSIPVAWIGKYQKFEGIRDMDECPW